MLESLIFYFFIIAISYVIYWSVARDPGPKAIGKKRRFSIKSSQNEQDLDQRDSEG